jgi:hypothetical protein
VNAVLSILRKRVVALASCEREQSPGGPVKRGDAVISGASVKGDRRETLIAGRRDTRTEILNAR